MSNHFDVYTFSRTQQKMFVKHLCALPRIYIIRCTSLYHGQHTYNELKVNRDHLLVLSGVHQPMKCGLVSQVPQFKSIQKIAFYITSKLNIFFVIPLIYLFNFRRDNEREANYWNFSSPRGIILSSMYKKRT